MKLENLSSLQCIPVVPYSITMERNGNLAGSAYKTLYSIRIDSIFLKLWKILDVLDIDQDSLLSFLSKETHFTSNQQQQARKKGLTELTLMINGARSILSKKQIYEIYCNWALQNPFRNIPNDKNKNTSMNYDVFFSYRWNKFDSLLVDRFYELSPFYSINSDKRLLSIFLDKKRLLDGRDFSTDFTSSLLHSRIVTPIISFKALEKMFSLREDSPVDNLLLEWIISIHCFMLKQSQQQQNQDLEGNNIDFIRIERIFPIFIGSVEVQAPEELINPPSRPLSGKPTRPISATNQSKYFSITNIKNLFSENISSRIPEIIPVNTLEKAQEIFSYYSIPFHEEKLKNWKLKEILEKLFGFLGIPLWEIFEKLKHLDQIKNNPDSHENEDSVINDLNIQPSDVDPNAGNNDNNKVDDAEDHSRRIFEYPSIPILHTCMTKIIRSLALLQEEKSVVGIEVINVKLEESNGKLDESRDAETIPRLKPPPELLPEVSQASSENDRVNNLLTTITERLEFLDQKLPHNDSKTLAEVMNAYFAFQYFLQLKEIVRAKEFYPVLEGISDIKSLFLFRIATFQEYEKFLLDLEGDMTELETILLGQTIENPSLFPMILEHQNRKDVVTQLRKRFQDAFFPNVRY
jgi:hypothetical protein